ncbi:hypothetical protein BEP19_12160 [Ammoniphilus oxalaticus]|uniref:Uncharacterized protein n=1 Tax=Ammoniphilus oxalaticus TaxID=66863 RepID=A0A419SGS6_9BACL|nr:hypothetical protein [Ammoniphilus oxalaticus]RKD22978.1 hypothetical protein BEP19_12160 [Ammoniphilus oxalaticus]
MALTKISLAETVKKQYRYKLKANIDALSSLVFVQALAILFSLGGVVSSGGGSSSGFSYNANYYTADLIIVFTMVWAFTTAITITTKAYRYHDFTFITNRLSSSLSNVLFLVTVSLLGAALSLLAGNLLKFIMYIQLEDPLYGIHVALVEILIGVIATFLYVLLFGALGYFVGTLVQVNKLFAGIFPILFIGSLIPPAFTLPADIVQFYGFESSLIVFTIKASATVTILFAVSTRIWKRLEVRS